MLLQELDTAKAATDLDVVAPWHGEGGWQALNAKIDWAPARTLLHQAFWTWYYQHEDDTILHIKKIIFLSVRVRVRHLYEVFKLIFGDPHAPTVINGTTTIDVRF